MITDKMSTETGIRQKLPKIGDAKSTVTQSRNFPLLFVGILWTKKGQQLVYCCYPRDVSLRSQSCVNLVASKRIIRYLYSGTICIKNIWISSKSRGKEPNSNSFWPTIVSKYSTLRTCAYLVIVTFHISNYYYTKLVFSGRFWHVTCRGPSHRGVYAQNLQTHGLKNDDEVTLVFIFCRGHVGIYQTTCYDQKCQPKWSKYCVIWVYLN